MASALVRPRSLPEVLVELQGKGVRRGVAGAPGPSARRPISTGHGALDAALHTHGLPSGSLVAIEANPGNGATTLALGTLAAAQAAGGIVAYLDVEGAFDPMTAAHLGIDLEWLLVVRPRDAAESVELAAWLARSALIDAFVVDLLDVHRRLTAAGDLERLGALLLRTGTTGVLLADRANRETATRAAGIRIAVERRAWLVIGRDLVGQRVAASVRRHRWAPAGGAAELDLWFPEGRRLDPLLTTLAVPRRIPSVEAERPALRVLSA